MAWEVRCATNSNYDCVDLAAPMFCPKGFGAINSYTSDSDNLSVPGISRFITGSYAMKTQEINFHSYLIVYHPISEVISRILAYKIHNSNSPYHFLAPRNPYCGGFFSCQQRK